MAAVPAKSVTSTKGDEHRFVTLGQARLECQLIGATRPDRPFLVFLHEGLGSLALWRGFPETVCAATGCGALVYSREGYGASTPIRGPRAVDYMHREAREVLPALLAGLNITAPVLVGHSDGASIALIYAGSTPEAVRGLVLMAPHVFVEDRSVSSIAAAKLAYEQNDLRTRLSRYHREVDSAFRGWNDIWLAPAFRDWNITAYLPRLRCPVLAIQGLDDEYGTMAQLDAIADGAAGPVRQLRLAQCRHSPHRDQPDATLEAIATFLDTLTAPDSA